MAKVSSSIELAIPAAQVWQLIGGFGSLPEWLPFIRSSALREGGRTRHLVTSDVSVIIEQLIAFDERARSYSYHILKSPFPVTEYYSVLKVSETNHGEGSKVDWSGSFRPKGVSENEALKTFQEIYDNGLSALAKHFAG